MKKIILALLLTAVAIPAQAQFQGVTTTANGTLHSPTNFWSANSLAIANGLPLAAPSVTSGLLSNGTQTIGGNKTFADNLTVQGNTTLGDAAGDSLTISGTITAANANGTAANSVANVGTLDARYGFAEGQTAAVSGNMRYAQGTTGGRRLFGTVANMANSTETKLFSATSVSNNLIGDTIGNLLVCFNNGNGSGVGSALIFYRGNQGAIVMQQSPTGTFAADGQYWISFTANLTLNTGDLITGNSSGATARVWRSSGLPGSVSDVWLYDVTGIFTSADTNLSINGNPSGVGVSNTAFGPSPAAGLRFFLYNSRLPDGTRVPAIFHRQGSTLSVLYDYTGF
jgi:hypothetical protein